MATALYHIINRLKTPQHPHEGLLRSLGKRLDVKVHVVCQAYRDAPIAAEEVAALAVPLVDPFDAQAVVTRLQIVSSAPRALEQALAQAMGDNCSRHFCPDEFQAGLAEWESAPVELDKYLLEAPSDFLRGLMLGRHHHHHFLAHQQRRWRRLATGARLGYVLLQPFSEREPSRRENRRARVQEVGSLRRDHP